MPREVEVRHRDARGTVVYTIYEKAEDVPGRIRDIWEAEEGDYVRTANGWFPPLLKKRVIEATRRYTAAGKSTKRKTPLIFWEFIFPKMKFICRPERLQARSFNYQPTVYDNAANVEGRVRAHQLTSRKLLWCQYVLAGMDPRVAVMCVWQENKSNHTRMAKMLLLQQPVINYLITQISMKKDMKALLEEKGMTDEAIVDELIAMAQGDDTRKKLWAYDKILAIKKEAAPPADPEGEGPKQLPPAEESEEKLRLQERMRQKHGDKYIGEAKPVGAKHE